MKTDLEREELSLKLFQGAFHPYREKRSKAYKEGAMGAIRQSFGLIPNLKATCPYPEGTDARDAWLSGKEEGYFIVKNYRRLEE